MDSFTITYAVLFLFIHLASPTLCIMENSLTKGSSLYVEDPNDILTSPNRVFSAGFYQVGDNAFCFAIWYEISVEKTVVWMANRDQPVNGKHSKVKLLKDGSLNLFDAGRISVWSSNMFGASSLQLMDSGNLILLTSSNTTLWQSFDSPINTLLPHQLFNKEVSLVSFKNQANYSSGFYKLYFDNDNVLSLLFDDGEDISFVYWPTSAVRSWEAGRINFNATRLASFNSYGNFESSDDLQFNTSDFGLGPHRRLTLDFDGNLRMYSLEDNGQWMVTWQAFIQQCNMSGLCGPNSLCKYVLGLGRKCTCLPGFRLKDPMNWRNGCEAEFQIDEKNNSQVDFIALPHVFFDGYDIAHLMNYTYEQCRDICLPSQVCVGFVLRYDINRLRYNCYPKARLLNGLQTPNYPGTMFLKVPKNINTIISLNSTPKISSKLYCGVGKIKMVQLQRDYEMKEKGGPLKFLVWFAVGIGILEMTCILTVWFFLYRTQSSSNKVMQGYDIVGFKRFTYDELKIATRNFQEEIGRGAYGVIYKGNLGDGRVAAIKKLQDASDQGAAEFLGEISIISRLNHMNLIDIWGYCAQGSQRLLVLEYMENKSLAEKLSKASLNWERRYDIALGTARGLAYLHEECLEWILHCDVKPQNILLDENFQPKVADFGLSKLMNRTGASHSSFSRIRGTRGYMAPEWITNQSITSKVDVYSYGVVLLEIVTGENPGLVDVVAWVREKKTEVPALEAWIEEIADPMMEGCYNVVQMQTLTLVALHCVKEDKDVRPTMSQVVKVLQGDHSIP